MIKNFRLYNKPNKGAKLCATILAGTLLLGSLTACSNTDNSQVFGQLPDTDAQTQTDQIKLTKTFAPGEHIISIPISDPTKEVKQYEYHLGYKCIGLSVGFAGGYSKKFDGACLLFVNEIEVECESINGKTFTEFGIPLSYEKDSTIMLGDGTKTFGTGEHIISVPISDPTDRNIQYQYYEGYEPLDIATSSYGLYSSSYAGGVILYSNVVPVICTPAVTKDNQYQYVTFGTPAEPQEILTLVK